MAAKKKKRIPRPLERTETRVTLLLVLLILPTLVTLVASNMGAATLVLLGGLFTIGLAALSWAELLSPLEAHNITDRLNRFLAFFGWLFGLHRESFLVAEVKVRRTIEGGTGLLPGVILVDGHSAVVTKDWLTLKPKHVVGPGAHFSDPLETISLPAGETEPVKTREVVDLRHQFRFQSVRAQTKDGMTIKAGMIAIFMIDREQNHELDKSHFFRFYDSAVFNAVQAERIGAKPSERLDWTTLPHTLGIDILYHIISSYTLDELYAPREDSEEPNPRQVRRTISDELTNTLREQLKPHGIHLVFAGLTRVAPEDPRVTKQRVELWRAKHRSRLEVAHALTEAEIEHQEQEARNQAQRMMTLKILDSLQATPPQYQASMLPLRFLETLEEMLTSSPHSLNEEALMKLLAQGK